MVAMTNIDGVLRDVNDPNSLISKITLAEAEQVEKRGRHRWWHDTKGRLLLRGHQCRGSKGFHHQW